MAKKLGALSPSGVIIGVEAGASFRPCRHEYNLDENNVGFSALPLLVSNAGFAIDGFEKLSPGCCSSFKPRAVKTSSLVTRATTCIMSAKTALLHRQNNHVTHTRAYVCVCVCLCVCVCVCVRVRCVWFCLSLVVF